MISARKKIAARFDEEVRFFKGWMHRPKAVGSVVPTSSVTARRMASVIDIDSGLPVLELGPGTGVITRAILAHGVKPQNLYSVEYSGAFVEQLRGDFPGVSIIEGDAFDLNLALGTARNTVFDSIISAVPMLNFPVAKRIELVGDLLNRVPAGRPVVQITYGPLSPVPVGKGDYTVKHFDFVLRNLPPAQLWVYSRPING